MRVFATALALIAIVAVPVAPLACVTRCESFLMHQHSACTERAHASMGPHVHHLSHVHFVNQDEPSAVAAQHGDRAAYAGTLGCSAAGCAGLGIAALATRRAGPPTKLGISLSLSLAAVANPGSTSISSHNTFINDGPGSEGPAPGIPAPLRV